MTGLPKKTHFRCKLSSAFNYCLRPSAKDQGITLVAVVLSDRSHFLFKRNLWGKKFSLARNWIRVLWNPSQALYQLSYSNIVTHSMENYPFNLRISKTMAQTSDQSWLLFSCKIMFQALNWRDFFPAGYWNRKRWPSEHRSQLPVGPGWAIHPKGASAQSVPPFAQPQPSLAPG